MNIFNWLHKNGEKYFLGAFAIVAFIAAALALIIPEWAITRVFHEHIPTFVLILLASYILVFIFGYESKMSKMTSTVNDLKDFVEQSRAGMSEHIRRWEGLGIIEIYKSRNDYWQREAYNSLMQQAASNLFIVGVTLKDLTRNEKPTLIAKASNGCSVRLLMLTPERWGNINPILDPVEPGDLKDHFVSAIRNIRRIAVSVANKNSGPPKKGVKRVNDLQLLKKAEQISFEIRFYDQAPSASLTIADMYSDSGRMRVEFTPHNETDLNQYFRPMLDLVPKPNGLFQEFFLHYDGLWKKSTAYICIVGSVLYVNNEIDDKISKILGLPEDKAWSNRIA